MKKYGKDYKRVEEGYAYTKEWYKSLLEREKLKKQAVLWMGASALLTLLFAAGLSLNNAGSRVFTILMPYVFMVFPIAYGWRGAISLYLFCKKQSGKNPERTDGSGKNASRVIVPKEHTGHMLRAEYEQGIRRSVRSAGLTTILAAVSLAADLSFLIMHRTEISPGTELVFAADTLLMLLTGILFTIQTQKTKNKFVKII